MTGSGIRGDQRTEDSGQREAINNRDNVELGTANAGQRSGNRQSTIGGQQWVSGRQDFSGQFGDCQAGLIPIDFESRMKAAIPTIRKPRVKLLLIGSLGSLFLWGCGPKETPVELPPAPEIKLSNGQTVEEVAAMLGEPIGRAQGQESLCFFYEGGGLEFKEGVLFGFTPELEQKILAGAAERRRKAELKQKTATKWWAVLQEKRAARKATNPLFKSPSRHRKKSRSADPIHEALLVPDKVTVVYFYASWCQGCTAYAPILQGLVRKHEGVALRRVNVGSRDSSEVWVRYNLRGVPSVRVFDRKGRMVGGTARQPDVVEANIERASRRFRWWDPFQKFRSLGEKISEFFPKMAPQ